MIAKALRDLRAAHNYTQLIVSERSGLSQSLLSKLEAGHKEPTLKTLCSIASVYGMGAGDLLVYAGHTTNGGGDTALQKMACDIARQSLEAAIQALGGDA